MGGGWPTACLVLAVLSAAVRGEEERWSRPATPERRQGDWVPLSCANCRPLADQSVQASNSLPSVLTPPPRSEEARLLPPPPPDKLFQQAATGFLQSFTQQQPPKKYQQYLQETTAQSVNRPQAQFLKAVNPKIQQQFLREPSQDFQPPQDPFQNRQPQLLQYNQQFQDQHYLNQPLLLGPQFLAPPFFPQTAIPPQNVQPISPIQLQPQQQLAPNVLPVNNQNFQVAPDRPLFTQQITAGQEAQPQGVGQAAQQFSSNETEAQRDDGEKEEVQLLYVPVETLKQRARGKAKAFPSGQQDVSAQQVQQALRSESNRFTTPQQQVFEQSTVTPSNGDQINFNTQTAKPQYNTKQNIQFQQQLPPEDQEKFNTQTHSVRQQFVNQNFQIQQQPDFGNVDNLKQEAPNTREQFNFKTNDKVQPEFVNFNPQFNFQPNTQFQQQPAFEGLVNLPVQAHNIRQQLSVANQAQQDQENFNRQAFNQQFRQQFEQQLPPLEQPPFSNPGLVNSQQQFNQNNQFNEQLNQQAFSNFREQPYVNQPIRLEQAPAPQQGQFLQQTTRQQSQQFNLPEVQQQTTRQQPQQFNSPEVQQQTTRHQFNLPEVQQQTTQQQSQQFNLPEVQQTISPVSQTVQPETFTSQEVSGQRFREPQQDSRRPQQVQNNQFLRKFPQDYQQSTTVPTSPSTPPTVVTTAQVQDLRHNTENLFHQHRNLNQQQYNDNSSPNLYKPLHQQSTLSPESSTTPSPKTTPAPNQPPLSVYMETTEESKVNDVLRLLKNAKSIQVLDTVGPESPQVFVGPSNLKPPSGYIKFELPYLNSLDSNRVERKVDKLPFFVAPLNFNPPPGYSKIPFPAPHIGSVVVSNATVLRTALHEKPYENEPLPVSSTEQYQNQFTFAESISPISPQLPSLINSLRDEIYSGSSTPSFPSTTTETTTEAYSTQAYRGRGSSRGTQRGSSNYIPATSATRKPQPRTRRPYSRRQPVTTTTTTEEPTSEVTLQQNITPQPDQLEYNSDSFNVHSVAPPASGIQENHQSNLQSGNIGNYYNEQFVANNFHQSQFAPQNVNHPTENQINQEYPATDIPQNFEQPQQFSQLSQNTHTVAQTTTIPNIASSIDQQESHEFKNQRTNNGLRRDPSRPHQRLRGRQRLTTTTTEVYEQPPPQPIQDQYQTQGSSVNDNVPSGQHLLGHNQHRLVENTHFTASVPQNRYNPQTERADVNFQTTERFTSAQNEDYNIQSNTQRGRFDSYLNTEGRQQFQQPTFSHNSESSQLDSQYNLHQSNVQLSQPNRNAEQDQSAHQFQQHLQGENLHPISSQDSQVQRFNQDQVRFNPSQGQQNYYDQQQQHDIHEQNQQFVNDQSQQTFNDQQVKDFSNDHRDHGHHTPTPGQLEQITEITPSSPQETFVQTTESVTSHSQEEREPQVQQFNQQRLLKYNRPTSRTTVTDATSTEEYRRGQQHFQGNSESPDAVNTDDVTTKASLVRVRGRVRSRQRGAVRQSTTTEEPNYPSGYLTKQRNSQENEGGQDYTARKRVNYTPRQTYTSLRNNKEASSEQSEAYSTTDKPTSLNSFVDYSEEPTSTTTEALSEKPERKYQHILNRNKLRRARPTSSPSTSGSSGTTRFLRPTTPPPVTRLPSTRGRIRKPVSTKRTTTEYPQVDSSWNERENFAPSAGSNEILEPLYQTNEKAQTTFGFQRNHAAQNIQPKTSPRPAVESDGDEYWNQGVTIHQSTSYDFKPDSSSVTPSSFKVSDEQVQGTFAPAWDGQIELQDGKYYNVFNQKPTGKNSDQTPFSTDQQKVVYKEIKGRRPTGKENQYTEKEYELKKPTSDEEEGVSQVYPVYREISRPIDTSEDVTFQNAGDQYTNDKKAFNGKDVEEPSERHTQRTNEEAVDSEAESEIKEGALKRKITATNSGKKVSCNFYLIYCILTC